MKNRLLKIFLPKLSAALFVLLISPSFSFAATVNWIGHNGLIGTDWNNSKNWSTGSVPTSSDDVYIGNVSFNQLPTIGIGISAVCKTLSIGGAYTANLTVNGTLTCGSININSTGTLNQGPGAILSLLGSITGTGTVTSNNASWVILPPGSQTLSGNLKFGKLMLGVGTTTVTGGSLTVSDTLVFLLGSTLDLSTAAFIGTPFISAGFFGGTLKTQNTSSTPLPAGLKWPVDVYYNGIGTQTVVSGNYTNLYASGGNRILSPTGNINISDSLATGTGSYTVTGSTVVYDGTAVQNIPSFSFHNLKISNAAGVTLSGPVRVQNSLGFGNVNNSVITTNGKLTFASSASNTANLLDLTNGGANVGNSISGLVTIERFIQGKRAYRFLSAPVKCTTSIKANWMEGVNNSSTSVNNNPVAGYGTHITGAGGGTNGFDATATNNPSLFTFNSASQSWVPAANTNTLLTAGTAYRIMVRGSRSVNLNSNTALPSTTTLRATGTLLTGNVTFTKALGGGTPGMPPLSAVTGAYSFIANPYPSDVNYDTLAKTDLDSSIYVFDPTISGSNGRGGYVAYNTIQGRNSNSSSQVNNHIQSGQAFFVQTKGPNPSLTFKENAKASVFRSVFRTANDIPSMNIQLLLPEQVNAGGAADGTAVYFSNDYSNTVCGDDSYKFSNQDENIAILRGGTALSLEGRNLISGADSVPLKIWQLTQKNYSLKITITNFQAILEAHLEDKFLKTTNPLSNDGETVVPFIITSDPASSAPDRFTVVFETFSTLPIKISSMKAYQKNKGIQIDWTAESESNMDVYEVERATDAQHFEKIGFVKAKNNAGIASAYNFFDANPVVGDNFYRIKAIEKTGDTKLSEVVKVQITDARVTISVTNNPVEGSTIKLLFNNAEKGDFSVSLMNSLGEKVYTGKMSYSGGTSYGEVNLNTHLPAGVYQMQINNSTYKKAIQILIK